MPTINNTEVRAVLEAWEAAWNASDMTAMWQLATDDIHWVNVVGMHWRGKVEVQKAHQVFFSICCSRTGRANWKRSKASSRCPAEPLLRSFVGPWAAIGGRMEK